MQHSAFLRHQTSVAWVYRPVYIRLNPQTKLKYSQKSDTIQLQ